ncbi:hypothetical protein [Oceanithermus desulfurans]|nr:hypothetical protein [Oceanithermus desulfurans]
MANIKPNAILRVWLYHDETKKAELPEGKRHAHGILVVPETLTLEWPPEDSPLFGEVITPAQQLLPREGFLSQVQAIRTEIKYDGELHTSEMTGKEWSKREAYGRRVLDLSCDSLRQKGPRGELPYPFFRFGALFFPPNTPYLREFYSGDDPERKLKYFETLMRMAIKGVLHYGYTGLDHVFASVEVEVLGLVLDGDEHLRRPIDEMRVIERLKPELRPGFSIAPGFEIRAVDSNPSRCEADIRERGDSELLQATDLLLGATRFVADGTYRGLCSPVGVAPVLRTKFGSRNEKMAHVYQPFCSVLRKSAERRQQSFASWKNSGHYRSFSASQAEPLGEGWKFPNIEWEIDEEGQLLIPLFPGS